MLWRVSRILLGVTFLVAGSLHFLIPRPYLRIMPPYLPFPRMLVYASGLAEMSLGAGMFTRFSRWAAWGLIALLVAVFPANLHMALHPDQFADLLPRSPGWRRASFWGRLPLQAVFIAWVHRYTGAADGKYAKVVSSVTLA